jgi:hypothetical protein
VLAEAQLLAESQARKSSALDLVVEPRLLDLEQRTELVRGQQSQVRKPVGPDRRVKVTKSTVITLNDNVIRRVDPHYVQLRVPAGGPGAGDPEDGPFGTATYDDMDRPLVVADSDRTVDPAGERTGYTYDDAGRLSKITKPRGMPPASTVTDDFTTLLRRRLG